MSGKLFPALPRTLWLASECIAPSRYDILLVTEEGFYHLSGILSKGPCADGKAAGVPDISGWVPMRTVAEVRRELGIGAPREKNSLYRPIERGPRKFNPLKIPKQLQVR